MSDLNRLRELTEQIVPPAFDDLVDVQHRRSRRDRAAMACGLVAGGAAVVVALMMTGHNDRTQPAPTTPSPTPSELFVIPGGQTTIPVDLQPGDVHAWDVLATVTNTQPEHHGASDLSTTVTANSEGGGGETPVSLFCRTSHKDIWLMWTKTGGAGGYGACDEYPKTFQPADIPQWMDPGATEPLTVHALITRVTPELETCLDKGDMTDCLARYGRPPATTDAEFGFRIYEHQSRRIVLTLWHWYVFEALSTIDEKPWLIDHAVVAAPGSDRLAVALPDSDLQRLVGVYSLRGPHWNACVKQHEAQLPTPEGDAAWRTAVEEACRVDFRLLVDGEYVEPPAPDAMNLFDFGEPVMYVAPGAHHVTVDVTGNDPRNVRFAVVIRKEQRQ